MQLSSLIYFQSYLDSFFDLFKYEWIPIFLSIILILLGLIVFVYFTIYKSRQLRIDLNEINSFLNRVFRGSKTENKEEFYDEYPRVEQSFHNLKTLSHAWDEFDETLLKPPEKGNIKNTIRPTQFFNDELIEKQLSQRMMMGWPNIFVALGLLFTFIGLVAALKETSRAFDKNVEIFDVEVTKKSLEDNLNKLKNYSGGIVYLNLENQDGEKKTKQVTSDEEVQSLIHKHNEGSIETALENLLKVATFKFVTSVVGIFISVFLLLSFRAVIRNLNNKIVDLCILLDGILEFQPAERIQEEIFTELRRQTYPIEKFAEDLGTAIGLKMQPISESIDNLANKLSSLNQEGLNDMIEKFFQSASGETKDMMANLTEKLNEVGEKVSGMATGMNQSGENFTSKVTDSTEQLEKVINDLSEKLMEQSKVIADFSRSTTSVSTALDSTATGFTHTADKLEIVSGKMEKTFGSLERSIAELSNLRENLSNVAILIHQSTEKMQSAWSTYEERFKDLDTNLTDAGKQFGEIIVARQKDSLQHIKDASEAMNKGVNLFRGAIEELDNTINEFRETLEKNNDTNNPTN